jgi:pilus assembly protein FimV
MNRASHKAWGCALLVAALMLLAGPALALGLGQIQVKSRPGEPLLAEIPVVASDPSELEQLQVRLASPETFRRVGLQPPDVAGTGLQLSVAVDAQGRPVIRVTSSVPLQQPVLSFLVEVDWGSGRLVREYTAVLDGPSAIAAPAQQVQAPIVARPDTIPRAPVSEPAPLPPADAVAAEPLPGDAGVPVAPAPPAPAPAQAPPDRPAAAPAAGAEYTVRGGDTLSEIGVGMDRGGHSLDQAMLALLRSNPEAFIGGNINRLRAGAVLRMPPAGELSRYSVGEAAGMVRDQVAQWRAANGQAQPRPDVANATAADQAQAGASPADRTTGARLEIVPPSAEGEAGSGSGIQAGGEGEMLRQARQTEAVAARDAEIGELRTRIAELEKIQQQQQQLIEMKDTALASAQQDLAARQDRPEAATGGGWWIIAGLLLVLAAAAAWLVLRRRAVPRRRLFGEPPPQRDPQ